MTFFLDHNSSLIKTKHVYVLVVEIQCQIVNEFQISTSIDLDVPLIKLVRSLVNDIFLWINGFNLRVGPTSAQLLNPQTQSQNN